MQSDVPVEVQDIDRRINADSMKVYDNGARIIFGGAAKMVIKNSNAIAPSPTPSPVPDADKELQKTKAKTWLLAWSWRDISVILSGRTTT